MAYSITQWSPLDALEWAPSDRVALIRRLTGVTVPVADSRYLLFLLQFRLRTTLLQWPELHT
jgi:hypothetical protein